MHIGLIGGIGPAATEFYYRGLVSSCENASQPLQLTIAHADLKVAMENLAADRRVEQAEVYNIHLKQLAAAGADVAAVTSIAGHFCFDELQEISPLPLVSALSALEQELRNRNLRRIGLIGSSSAVASSVFGALRDFDIVVPEDRELQSVSDAYFAMAVARQATDEQRRLFFQVGSSLCANKGAESIVLAGTDLFLAFENQHPPFDFVDSAVVHYQKLATMFLHQ